MVVADNTLYAIMNPQKEFITRGSTRSKRLSKTPHVYTNKRNAEIGLKQVEQKEGEELKVVPFVPLDDLISAFKIIESMLPFAGSEIDIEEFRELLANQEMSLDEECYIYTLKDK
ncbi:hypothetical protein MOC11_01850 [Bacillus haynesii]|uniref:hypothetical protein n=1 Tax=Bacillus haynesii TaxID=1925021 RepID=UPI00227DE805|nr:hypothetical protein [Bacillus haynesii]MCY8015488.1 hypothetical protein [Bacillus haynesii]